MPTTPRPIRFPQWRPLRRRCVALGLGLALAGPISAQTIPARPDSVVVPSPGAAPAVPDTVRRPPAPPPEPPPDADPTPGPVSRRAGLIILGVCALLTVSTLLLYNVRSR